MGRVPACVAGHGRGWYHRHTADTAAGADAAGTTSPRIGLVIGLWQCDKENHGWGEGLPLTVAAKFRSEDRAFTLPARQSRTKREYCFQSPDAIRLINFGRYMATSRNLAAIRSAKPCQTEEGTAGLKGL